MGTSSAIGSKRLTPGILRSYFRRSPKSLRDGAPGDRWRAIRGTLRFVDPSPDPLEPRRQRHPRDRHHSHDASHLCGYSLCPKHLRGAVRPPRAFSWSRAGRQFQLANPPYQQAWIPPAYRRQIVDYHRKEAPGTILVDTDARYVYFVLPKGRAIRYGAIVGEDAQAWSGVATVGRKEEWPGWTPTEGEKRRLGPLPNYVEGGARNPMGARALYLYAEGKDTLYRIHGTNQPGWRTTGLGPPGKGRSPNSLPIVVASTL